MTLWSNKSINWEAALIRICTSLETKICRLMNRTLRCKIQTNPSSYNFRPKSWMLNKRSLKIRNTRMLSLHQDSQKVSTFRTWVNIRMKSGLTRGSSPMFIKALIRRKRLNKSSIQMLAISTTILTVFSRSGLNPACFQIESWTKKKFQRNLKRKFPRIGIGLKVPIAAWVRISKIAKGSLNGLSSIKKNFRLVKIVKSFTTQVKLTTG